MNLTPIQTSAFAPAAPSSSSQSSLQSRSLRRDDHVKLNFSLPSTSQASSSEHSVSLDNLSASSSTYSSSLRPSDPDVSTPFSSAGFSKPGKVLSCFSTVRATLQLALPYQGSLLDLHIHLYVSSSHDPTSIRCDWSCCAPSPVPYDLRNVTRSTHGPYT